MSRKPLPDGDRGTATHHPPVIATVIGDPGGVGPEVCVKALADGSPGDARHLLIGDVHSLRAAAATSGLDIRFRVISAPPAEAAGPAEILVLDPGTLDPAAYRTGEPSAAAGRAVVEWIRLAERMAEAGDIDGWIMGPLDSTSLKLAGEITALDDLQPANTWMLRVSPILRVVPLSEHISIAEVPATVTREGVLHLIRLAAGAFRRWGVPNPRIGVAGLNPHAMGREDAEEIAPAVADAKADGWMVEGPVSPDSIFRQAIEGKYDVIVSMYHDQGQIPLKTAAFEGACTIYLGLDHVHLTIPHGSAMDIAGKGLAQHASMAAAMRMAASLCNGAGFVDG